MGYHAVFEEFASVAKDNIHTLRIAPFASGSMAGRFGKSIQRFTAAGIKDGLRMLESTSLAKLQAKNIELWIFIKTHLAVEADLPWRSCLEIEGIYNETDLPLMPPGVCTRDARRRIADTT